MNVHRMHLELMLNPSEKDHRLLMMLVRRCTHPNTYVAQDEFVRSELRTLRDSDCLPSGSKKLVEILLRKGLIPERDRGVTISYIVRLSNIIFKREWMRVRDAQ